jgi:hypothetical protein
MKMMKNTIRMRIFNVFAGTHLELVLADPQQRVSGSYFETLRERGLRSVDYPPMSLMAVST